MYYLCEKGKITANSPKNLIDMDIIEELKRIAALTPADVTADDKAFIREQATAVGLKFKPSSACKSCYIDEAVVIYRRLKDIEKSNAGEEPARRWILKEGIDVVWRNIRICADTITDEKAEQYLRSGFPRKYFI